MKAFKGKKISFLFMIGFLGVLSTLPLIPQLLASQPEPPPIPLYVVQLVSVIQSAVLLLGMVLLGYYFAPKIKLETPIFDAFLNGNPRFEKFNTHLTPALIGGIVGGIFIIVFTQIFSGYLPTEFLAAGSNFELPWYTRLLYGGITEELLIRWGLMSFFVWGSFRLTQAKGSSPRAYNYLIGILLSAVVFGLGHLPAAFSLTPVVTTSLIVYIIIGNAGFGIIAGYLFWKRGLESAIIAHMVAHMTMLVATIFVR